MIPERRIFVLAATLLLCVANAADRAMDRLPPGSVRPQGWLLRQMELQRDGLTGRAEELYDDIGNSDWLTGAHRGKQYEWERGPYYAKGLLSLAFALDDATLKAQAKRWVDAILASQLPDGDFGPKRHSWWANMISLWLLRDWAEAHRLYLHHWFFSTDLKYYVRGGRISKTSGFIGGILGICPLLNVNDEGKLIPREKIRGKKRVIAEIVERMKAHAEGGSEYSGKCFISMSACEEEAKAVATLVEEAFPKLNGKVHIFDIGTTIGSHTGPGTVALFFWGDKRGH